MIAELLNNIADHSNTTGTAMAQYYKSRQKIYFCAFDDGVGFLANLSAKFKNITTQEQAITKALEKGISASSNRIYNQERNAGYGLFVIDYIVKKLPKSELIILCKDTLINIDAQGKSTHHIGFDTGVTALCFALNMSCFANLDYDIDSIIRMAIIDDEDVIF